MSDIFDKFERLIQTLQVEGFGNNFERLFEEFAADPEVTNSRWKRKILNLRQTGRDKRYDSDAFKREFNSLESELRSAASKGRRQVEPPLNTSNGEEHQDGDNPYLKKFP